MQGFIDYTLAKRALLRDFRRGAVDRLDICDSHPELVRAARNIGEDLDTPCPICDGESLRQVRYVYGDQLKHLSGHPVYPKGWELTLIDKYDEFRCYQIEICMDCGWNHLAACYLMGRRYKPRASSPKTRRRNSAT